jgi:hypothetical protein
VGIDQAYLDNHDECSVVLGKVSDELEMDRMTAVLTLYMCLMGVEEEICYELGRRGVCWVWWWGESGATLKY